MDGLSLWRHASIDLKTQMTIAGTGLFLGLRQAVRNRKGAGHAIRTRGQAAAGGFGCNIGRHVSGYAAASMNLGHVERHADAVHRYPDRAQFLGGGVHRQVAKRGVVARAAGLQGMLFGDPDLALGPPTAICRARAKTGWGALARTGCCSVLSVWNIGDPRVILDWTARRPDCACMPAFDKRPVVQPSRYSDVPGNRPHDPLSTLLASTSLSSAR